MGQKQETANVSSFSILLIHPRFLPVYASFFFWKDTISHRRLFLTQLHLGFCGFVVSFLPLLLLFVPCPFCHSPCRFIHPSPAVPGASILCDSHWPLLRLFLSFPSRSPSSSFFLSGRHPFLDSRLASSTFVSVIWWLSFGRLSAKLESTNSLLHADSAFFRLSILLAWDFCPTFSLTSFVFLHLLPLGFYLLRSVLLLLSASSHPLRFLSSIHCLSTRRQTEPTSDATIRI